MDWKAHSAIGAVFGAAAAYLLGAHDPFGLLLFAFFGALSSLLPDLDHESSKGRKLMDSLVIVLALFVAYLYSCGATLCIPELGSEGLLIFSAIVGAYLLFFRIFKPRHRGITHTLAACGAYGIVVFLAAGMLPAAVGAAGYLSHLLADRHVQII